MNPDKARNILKECRCLLNEIKCTWWLSAGTALGLYRDKLNDIFLLKDSDLDFGVLGDEDHHKICLTFLGNGYSLYTAYKVDDYFSQLSFKKDGIVVDFYFFYSIDGMAVNYNYFGVMGKPLSMVTDTEIFEGFPLPSPIEEYLAVRYGPKWGIPDNSDTPWYELASNLIRKSA